MALDRRELLLAGCLGIAAACSPAGQARNAAIKSVSWSGFKAAFLAPSGRIVDNGNHGISHTEGQGFALAMALRAGDRSAFTTILDWTERTLARSDVALFSWRYDPRQRIAVTDRNNATDGDIFIAWALADAARQWHEPHYAMRSAAIRAAIRQHLVLERYGRQLLLPAIDGFITPTAVTLNPSYFIWPALDEFRRLDGDKVWAKVIDDGEALLGAARFGPYGLPTDWIDVSGHDTVTPAIHRSPRFGFDAIRVPLYAMAGRRPGLAKAAGDFWRDCLAHGGRMPAWIDVETGESASYSLSSGGTAIANRLLGLPVATTLAPDYYAAALQIISAVLA